MNNFNHLEKALEITAAILAIYQWCPSLAIATAIAIVLGLIEKCDDNTE